MSIKRSSSIHQLLKSNIMSSTSIKPNTNTNQYKFIDIGSNLSDPIFRGIYNQKQIHSNDLDQIIERAQKFGVEKQILTGDCLSGSKEVIQLSHQFSQFNPFPSLSNPILHLSSSIIQSYFSPSFFDVYGFYATVGCHPCRVNEFEIKTYPDQVQVQVQEDYLNRLEELIKIDQALERSERKVVAIGECGLDYDRLSYASKETQLRHFPPQLKLARKYRLPLFLHSRTSEAHLDLVSILKSFHEEDLSNLLPPRRRGVIHSFTGSLEEMKELIGLGYSIGINGCSLKTEENLNVIQHIPLDRLLLETDCPWCEIRPSHASFKLLIDLPKEFEFECIKKEKFEPQQSSSKLIKGRNEPCRMIQIGWVVSKLMKIELEDLVRMVWKNSMDLFQLDQLD
ncbi:hypothetical protein DFH28DRAFT_975482 [Melampsora americana]|nr:hypothetical protein DFH28DRAFT_975482 [Melampsora americana]